MTGAHQGSETVWPASPSAGFQRIRPLSFLDGFRHQTQMLLLAPQFTARAISASPGPGELIFNVSLKEFHGVPLGEVESQRPN